MRVNFSNNLQISSELRDYVFFSVVGAISYLLNLAVCFLLNEYGQLHHNITVSFGFFIGAYAHYRIIKSTIFHQGGETARRVFELPKFFSIVVANYCISLAVINIGHSILAFNLYLSITCATLFTNLFGYIASKTLVFNQTGSRSKIRTPGVPQETNQQAKQHKNSR